MMFSWFYFRTSIPKKLCESYEGQLEQQGGLQVETDIHLDRQTALQL